MNDAPALVAANVGISVGSGTDVARESASIVLLGEDLTRLVEVMKIARQCHRIIMTNFFGTIAVDTVGVGLAAFGFLNPILAALIHVTSELAFILNSARLVSARDTSDWSPRVAREAASSRTRSHLNNGRSLYRAARS